MEMGKLESGKGESRGRRGTVGCWRERVGIQGSIGMNSTQNPKPKHTHRNKKVHKEEGLDE